MRGLLLIILVACAASATIVKINVANTLNFTALLRSDLAPFTTKIFLSRLPWTSKLVQTRWSGEAGWIPMGNTSVEWGVDGTENPISFPPPGMLLFYPKGISETEILFPFGVSRFGSKFGPLSGSPFLEIQSGQENYDSLAEKLEYEGVQTISFTVA